jgi:cobalamin biosynthesis protein CbiG
MSECVICIQKIKDKVLTPCNHEFCRECILQWVVKKHNCPLCRQYLNVKSLTGRITRSTAALTRIYNAIERFTEGPKTLERMIDVFSVVLMKNNEIILKSNKDFREAYNEKVKQAEEIFDVGLENYYYNKKK